MKNLKRREFFGITGYSLAGLVASRFNPENRGNEAIHQKSFDTIDISSAEELLPEKPVDFEALRKDFPPLQKFRAYMDTAYVGLMPRQVKTAHDAYLEERFQFGPFPQGKTILGAWLDKTELVRKKLAAFLGAESGEIAFTYCTGCGSNIALKGINWKKGDNAIIDDLEYPNDFHVLNSLKKKGVEIRIARNEKGIVSPEKFEALTDRRTRAISVSHISHLNGFRHNLKKLAEIVHSVGGYLFADSAQAVGGVKVDVKEEDVDFLSSIPYKWLNGPNGTGFLYVRKELIPQIEPDRLGWKSTGNFSSFETMESAPFPDTARRYEYGTLGFESIYALDAALDYINKIGIEEVEKRNVMLISLLREKLREKGVKFYTPENNRSPILSFYCDDEVEFGRKMRAKEIYITARRWRDGHIRVSPHFYNNEEDIEAFTDAFPD